MYKYIDLKCNKNHIEYNEIVLVFFLETNLSNLDIGLLTE